MPIRKQPRLDREYDLSGKLFVGELDSSSLAIILNAHISSPHVIGKHHRGNAELSKKISLTFLTETSNESGCPQTMAQRSSEKIALVNTHKEIVSARDATQYAAEVGRGVNMV